MIKKQHKHQSEMVYWTIENLNDIDDDDDDDDGNDNATNIQSTQKRQKNNNFKTNSVKEAKQNSLTNTHKL